VRERDVKWLVLFSSAFGFHTQLCFVFFRVYVWVSLAASAMEFLTFADVLLKHGLQILGSEIREVGLHGVLVFFVTCMIMGLFYSSLSSIL